VSHALGRLRDAFEDDLFTRGPGGLLPTARATELAPRVHDILVTIRDAFARSILWGSIAHVYIVTLVMMAAAGPVATVVSAAATR